MKNKRYLNEEKEVMKGMRRVLLMGFILLMLVPVFGQNNSEEFNPELIDIFSFDPTEQVSSQPTDYRQTAYGFYQEGKFDQAARYYLAHLKFNPDDASSWYNLSCSFGLLGEAKEAARYLKIAYKKGFKDLQHIRTDKDFDKVKTAKTFTAALDSLQMWSEKEAFYKGKMEYFAVKQYLPYWVHLPRNYDPAKKYTLLIGLHGFGDIAPRFANLLRYIDGEDIIFVVPEAPYAFPDNDKAAFSWTPFADFNSKTSQSANAMLEKYVIDLTKHLAKQFKVKQTWLLGFSQGAYAGYVLSIKNPKVFDGLIACGGGLRTELLKNKDYRAARNLDIIISHGRQDKVVDFSEADKSFSLLVSKGMKVTLHAFEGGHSVSPAVFEELLKRIR